MSLKLPRNWDFSTFKAETARIARSKSVIPGEGGPGPGSPRSARSMERPLKAGWLKKQQRSLRKNWQQRYFVLRGSTLTYHKDDKETTVQGVIQLRFSKVNELPPNSDDPGKYLFEIIPCPTGDRERCPYVFMANSQSDMEEWVRTLRRVIGVPTSGVFGKSLMDTITYEQRFGPHMVPILVQTCVEYIKENGLNEEGIFRLPGQDNAVKQFRDAFDAGERPSFPSDTDVHTVASLLKLYLRELPEPVVPWTQYQDFLDCTNLLDCSSMKGWEKLEKQIALLPRINYNLLSYVCRFLFEVQQHSSVNKMNVENLATVMGINLLKPQIEDPITVMKATPQIQKLMTVMIRQHETLFPLSKDVLPSPPSNKTESQKNTPRSFVGWESAEMADASLSESPEEEEDTDSPGPDRGNGSPRTVRPEPLSPCTDDWLGSPRKRTQTLPTFNCPLTGMAAKADALNRWSRIQESVEEKSGTLSEDIFKILDLRSSGSLFGGSQMSIKEGEDRLTSRSRSDNTSSSTTGSQKPDSESRPARVLAHQKSAETLTVGGSGQQVNSKSELMKDSQQLVDSLQQENKELKATVAELHSALEAERRRVAALEICLRNAERSRDEAQRRNEELQRDIQQFLTTKPQAPT
ncbi:rho GTPase-activating protein 25 [Xiphias gladius]|uniref:rho GTPase-activating protein 25 n=1 Tax=Xiphias gladius TaxID=8245 RepID=UPI001A985F81|nr:rho GTPase-activating protein 25 [Xiphias gladius]XP_040011688.1 rho GTPase-activating protein 25 [Xiphias gladius]XP_040011689.1 rho GTPase-activating protein 25 [Xiphias gladius]